MTSFRQSSRREFLRRGGLFVPASAGAARVWAQEAADLPPSRNVLLILVADLRTELGCFGSAKARTPHIDRLAKSGVTFLRHYCQQAASGPSRTSLMTGLRPDTTRVYDDRVHFRRAAPDAVTLPEHFRSHGYVTTALGRVFDRPALDDRQSWSVTPWVPGGPAWRSSASAALADSQWSRLVDNRWLTDEPVDAPRPNQPSWQSVDTPEAELPDCQVARAAAAAITDLKHERFFIAAGFSRPGLPLIAPRRYFDIYPAGTWGGPQSPEPPQDAPPFALHGSQEIRAFADIPDAGPIPEARPRN